MSWKPHFIASHSPKSQEAKAELEHVYGKLTAEQANVLVPVGGDGLILKALILGLQLNKPVYPMHRGTKGNKANDYHIENLEQRLDVAEELVLHPLKVVGVGQLTKNGKTYKVKSTYHAMNDVYIKTVSPSEGCQLDISTKSGLKKHIEGDGIVIATPFGNGAYTRSAGGPHIALCDKLLTATAICPYDGSLKSKLSDTDIVRVKGLSTLYRPIRLVADNKPQLINNLLGCKITLDKSVHVRILYDPSYIEKKRNIELALKRRKALSIANQFFSKEMPWQKERGWL